jgi:NADPH:quinone reductase-like Zn-dependent oxidoreductase
MQAFQGYERPEQHRGRAPQDDRSQGRQVKIQLVAMIQEKMIAVFLEGEQLIVKETDVPKPGKGEVLVKISAAPVNPSDLAKIRNAGKGFDAETFIPGLEGSGRVVAAGNGLLPRLWMGKRVACSAHYSTSGTWSEYMVTGAGMCFPLNKNVTDEQGSMSLVNPLTAIEFIEIARNGKHKALINNAAAGALGRMVELLGNKTGITVINIVRSKKNADLLRNQGSKYVLDSSGHGFIKDLEALAEKLNATLLFDSVLSEQLDQMIGALPTGSSVIIYGNLTQSGFININPRGFIDNDIRISGFFLGTRSKENGMVRNMLNLIRVGKLMSSDMKISIAGRYPLEKAQAAVDAYINDMSAGKVLLVP